MLFFFNDTATTEIYTLSLHDALPICPRQRGHRAPRARRRRRGDHAVERSSVRDDVEARACAAHGVHRRPQSDRKSTRLNSSHANISYAVFCLKKKKNKTHSHDCSL